VWAEQPFEVLLKERLLTLPGTRGEEIFADYVSARRYVIENVVEHIGTAEPDLTDHGPRHLADVMDRVYKLLLSEQNYCTPRELYILAVAILFHDVGNLHGRTDHQKKIAGIYASARGTESRFRNERNSVLAIAGAHTGTTQDGSKNTIAALGRLNYDAESIRGQELAALLRLGDELAEGPHRTSAYLQNHGMYSAESAVFHAYADSVEYSIEGELPGRIAMTFSIDIHRVGNELFAGRDVTLTRLMQLCYLRIVKVDQERRYCKHFCRPLQRLTATTAWFNFYYQNYPLDLDLHPIVLDDLVIPGDPAKSIHDVDPSYELAALIRRLSTLCP
jgi:hypothetical protein